MKRNDIVLALTSTLILHQGAEPAAVMRMGRTQSKTSGDLWINPERFTVSHHLPEELPGCKDEHPTDPAEYLAGGGVVELSLLPPLSNLIRLYEQWRQGDPDSDTYLQLESLEGSLRPVTLADLEAWLYHFCSSLTPARLRRAFAPLYAWAGLEPILCAFIANHLPADLRATAFYVSISTEELATRYAIAHRRVLALIEEAL